MEQTEWAHTADGAVRARCHGSLKCARENSWVINWHQNSRTRGRGPWARALPGRGATNQPRGESIEANDGHLKSEGNKKWIESGKGGWWKELVGGYCIAIFRVAQRNTRKSSYTFVTGGTLIERANQFRLKWVGIRMAQSFLLSLEIICHFHFRQHAHSEFFFLL